MNFKRKMLVLGMMFAVGMGCWAVSVRTLGQV